MTPGATTDEQTLRSHFAARDLPLTEVKPRPDLGLGSAFVVRHASGGGLALVRGNEVISEPAAASVDRMIELDGAERVMKIDPSGFLALLQQWHAVPPDLGGLPIRRDEDARIVPQWSTTAGVPRFILHAGRSTHAGSRTRPVLTLRRAIGALGAKGLTWTYEDVELPAKP